MQSTESLFTVCSMWQKKECGMWRKPCDSVTRLDKIHKCLLIMGYIYIYYLSIYLSVCLSVCLSVYLCLSVCLSVCLSIYIHRKIPLIPSARIYGQRTNLMDLYSREKGGGYIPGTYIRQEKHFNWLSVKLITFLSFFQMLQ